MTLARIELPTDRSAEEVLRCLADDRLPFALIGRWAGGGAVLGSEPVRVVEGTAVTDVLDGPAVEAPDGFVGGGWVGYFGFGLGAAFERLPPGPPRPVPLPVARLAFYDHVLRLDRRGRWWFEALDEGAVGRRLAELERRLMAPPRPRPWDVGPLRPFGAGAVGHCHAVSDCVERVAAGELFQANLCLRLQGRFAGSSLDAFAAAAARLRPAYAAYLGYGRDAVLSFSPELFLRRRGREVETAPIKGTTPRPADVAQARAARDALVSSSKDAAEHVMIVDLMRNDLGRVAEYGSVRAGGRPTAEAHPGLWHLVTRVRARLRTNVTDADRLRATFPPGSVTGAPKIQALKVISALETTAREVYTGAIGIVSPASGLELNVAIRTLEIRDAAAWLGCGGGIVADSSPERELQEAYDKVAPIAAALGTRIDGATYPRRGSARPGGLPTLQRRPDPTRGVLETALVQDGEILDLDSHLERLGGSLRELFGQRADPALRRRLLAAAASAPPGEARLRVTVEPNGHAEVTLQPVQAPAAPLRLAPLLVPGGLGAHKWADRRPLAALERPGVAALICDADGVVLEASSANVWMLVGGRLLTPPADGRLLAGTTRHRALQLGCLDDISLEVGSFSLADLRAADGILLTSAIRGAVAAGLGAQAPASRAHQLAAMLREHLRSRALVRHG